ncbi:hypothetical protein [Aquimarina aggregata]|uniref:hypothetical protein n=1 Tax=Aquimarina aggregata TaxID=1642818 RepID=UPI002492CC3D|nr:hypothetical protein [Aquimarina aggregata]
MADDIFIGNAKPHWKFGPTTLVWSIDVKELLEILKSESLPYQYQHNGRTRVNIHITKRKKSVESGSTHFIKVDTYIRTH